YGLFGGIILGFLGTAMPRMLSAPALGLGNVLLLLALHLLMVANLALQHMVMADRLFLLLLSVFSIFIFKPARHLKGQPPPGFILVGMAFLCAVAGTLLALFQSGQDGAGAYWVNLQRLLCYQGFILLPILGVGPFILPRFFGLPSPHDFPESL